MYAAWLEQDRKRKPIALEQIAIAAAAEKEYILAQAYLDQYPDLASAILVGSEDKWKVAKLVGDTYNEDENKVWCHSYCHSRVGCPGGCCAKAQKGQCYSPEFVCAR